MRPPKSRSGTNDFFKHQFAPINHKIFMKQIGSIVFFTKSPGIFDEDVLIILWLFGVFSCLKFFLLVFHQEKLSCNVDIKMMYCTKSLFFF